MSRFDSPAQVVGLFLAASLVSIALIFLINAETEAELRRARAEAGKEMNTQNADQSNPIINSIGGDEDPPVPQTHQVLEHHIKPHISLLHYLESGVEKLFGGRGGRQKRSLSRVEREDPTSSSSGSSSSRRKHSSLVGGGESNFPRLNFSPPDATPPPAKLVPPPSSDNHKIRHARKKLDEKGLEGVLQILFDTNSIKESNSNHNHHQNGDAHHRRRAEVLDRSSPSDIISIKEVDDDGGGGGGSEGWRNNHQPQPFHQMSEESKVQRKEKILSTNTLMFPNGGRQERNFETSNKVGDEYLEYMVEVEVPSVPTTRSSISVPVSSVMMGEEEEQSPYSLNPSTNLRLNHTRDEMSSSGGGGGETHHKKSAAVLKQNLDVCYRTDDVLVIIAITCCLNFTFVLVIWACVRWFSSGTKDLKEFQHLDCEGGGDSTVFPHETVDNCWVPGSHRSRKSLVNGTSRLTSTSLYTFRPDTVPQSFHHRKSYSHSMEDLHFSYR